jgi:hypothetical protein
MRTKINALICKQCSSLFETSKRSDTKYCSQRCYLDNRNSLRKDRIDYYNNNKEYIRAKNSARYNKIKDTTEFKEKQRAYAYKYQKQRSFIDLNYKLRKKLRSRLATAITIGQKAGSAIRDLGCSMDEFKAHIESKWKPGMTWENWTHTGWHIDHIKPLCNFDLTNEAQFKEACNYMNLQPIWKHDHLLKTANDLSEHNSYKLS